jgi:hypothetical protein
MEVAGALCPSGHPARSGRQGRHAESDADAGEVDRSPDLVADVVDEWAHHFEAEE